MGFALLGIEGHFSKRNLKNDGAVLGAHHEVLLMGDFYILELGILSG